MVATDDEGPVTLSFTMPAQSSAALAVASRLLVRAPELDLRWFEGSRGVTVLYLECHDDESARVRSWVTGSHPGVVDTTEGVADGPRRSGRRSAVGRRRR